MLKFICNIKYSLHGQYNLFLLAGISCLIHFSHENHHYKTKFAVNKRLREGIFGMFC